jgi:hypothetical protein
VVDTGPTATSFKTSLTALSDANFVKGMSMVFYGTSSLTGQARQIKQYTIANGVMALQGTGFTRAPQGTRAASTRWQRLRFRGWGKQ